MKSLTRLFHLLPFGLGLGTIPDVCKDLATSNNVMSCTKYASTPITLFYLQLIVR
jgi:hypothetical protein